MNLHGTFMNGCPGDRFYMSQTCHCDEALSRVIEAQKLTTAECAYGKQSSG